ncbi:hypothetical protein [Aeromonas veronii]|uniref:hypothetical protein n=1 Tax=Aeromonas veronii TaxID=654 RepID=UPI00211D2E50|nr:hypothetical protein [Aeromonas veronii]UUM67397.1 hypothetical protein NQU90_13125 [Aeromonas veronii]
MERYRNSAGDAGRSRAGAIEQSKPAVRLRHHPSAIGITDACLSWSDTETLLAEAAQVRLSKQA